LSFVLMVLRAAIRPKHLNWGSAPVLNVGARRGGGKRRS
jgi:hypothetical protein